MNIIEAYRYLKKGYWIKRKGWDYWSRLGTQEDCFGRGDAEGLLICDEDYGPITLVVIDDVLTDDWEIKKEND